MRALRFLCAFVALVNTVCGCQQLAGDWHNQVQEYAKAQQWDSAIAVINEELKKAPEDPELLEWRARLLLWAGQLDAAALEWLSLIHI